MPPLPEQGAKLGLEEEEEDISFSLHANLVCTSFGSLCGTEYRFLSIAISPGFTLVSVSLMSPFYPIIVILSISCLVSIYFISMHQS